MAPGAQMTPRPPTPVPLAGLDGESERSPCTRAQI